MYHKSEDFDTLLETKSKAEDLPKGVCPIWLRVDEKVSTQDVLKHLDENYIKFSENKTILYQRSEFEKRWQFSGMNEWFTKNGWKCIEAQDITGCEDQCIVLLDCPLYPEFVSRARNQLIIITSE